MKKLILLFLTISIILFVAGCSETTEQQLDNEEPIARYSINGNPADTETITEKIDIQTEHPYENYSNSSWTIEAPVNAENISIQFDKFITESNYDYVDIYDATGSLIHHLDGNLSGKSFLIQGNIANIEFSSDFMVQDWGFAISKYSYTIKSNPKNDLSLIPVKSSNDLKNYISEVAANQIMEPRPIIFKNGPISIGSAESKVTPDNYTTTNVQEKGVDEADIVETDGEYVYVLNEMSLIILDSWPADETREISRIELGDYSHGMFLNGNRITVISSNWKSSFKNGATQITIIDITNRSKPKIHYKSDIEGYYINSRTIDGKLYLITSSNLLNKHYSNFQKFCDEIECRSWAGAPSPEEAKKEIKDELYKKIRSYLKTIPDEEILPNVLERGRTRQAVDTTSLHRPRKAVQNGLLMFSSIDMNSFRPVLKSSGIIGKGYNVYSSLKNIYITQSSQFWFWWQPLNDDERKTVIHKLSLPEGGDAPIYEASGSVPGWTLDQFSMSEHNGLLRIATTEEWRLENNKGSHVFILEQKKNRLLEVGSIQGMSPEQRIFAVRFMGDLGYVVTFEQIDPLHVLDLSNPNAPIQLGELEIPGFSTYLHPYKKGLLIGIGRSGDNAMQLSMFDVSNPEKPIRTHQRIIDTKGWSNALYDHHAFTFYQKENILAIPATAYGDNNFSGTIMYRVDEIDGFGEMGRIDHGDLAKAAKCDGWLTDNKTECDSKNYWINMQRNVFIENSIYSISNVGLKVNDINMPKTNYASLVWNLGPWDYSDYEQKKIPDFNPFGVESTIEVDGKPDCGDSSIYIDLSIFHPYPKDLAISLTDPAGKKNFIHRYDADSDNNLYLYRVPVSKLGKNGLNGSWTLKVADNMYKDKGTLNYWRLQMSCGSRRID